MAKKQTATLVRAARADADTLALSGDYAAAGRVLALVATLARAEKRVTRAVRAEQRSQRALWAARQARLAAEENGVEPEFFERVIPLEN